MRFRLEGALLPALTKGDMQEPGGNPGFGRQPAGRTGTPHDARIEGRLFEITWPPVLKREAGPIPMNSRPATGSATKFDAARCLARIVVCVSVLAAHAALVAGPIVISALAQDQKETLCKFSHRMATMSESTFIDFVLRSRLFSADAIPAPAELESCLYGRPHLRTNGDLAGIQIDCLGRPGAGEPGAKQSAEDLRSCLGPTWTLDEIGSASGTSFMLTHPGIQISIICCDRKTKGLSYEFVRWVSPR